MKKFAARGMDGQVGFTLIELMFVVAIIGILAAWAFPAYQDSVRKGKRGEGKSALLQAAQAEERYFTANNTYTTDLSAAGYKAYSGETSYASAYTLTVSAGDTTQISSSFKITATPTNGFSDSYCNKLTINDANVKDTEGGSWDKTACWKG